MSERITAANLDEVIKRNEVIEEQMKQSASLIWSKYNPMQINSPIQLALQILRPYGLIQLPIDNHYTLLWKLCIQSKTPSHSYNHNPARYLIGTVSYLSLIHI